MASAFRDLLFSKDNRRWTYEPVADKEIDQKFVDAETNMWTADEINLQVDKKHFKQRLSDDERKFVLTVLAFFAASDGIVNENLAEAFLREVLLPEARAFYGLQVHIENVHAKTYSRFIMELADNAEQRAELFNAVNTMDCVSGKAKWAKKWIDNRTKVDFALRLVAFAAVEGIFFSGSFCAIFWLRKRGLCPGLGFANELISRDEASHCDFACLLFNKLKEHSKWKPQVLEIIKEAVETELQFVTDALPVEMIGMNSTLMAEYIKFVADRLLLDLGYHKIYNTANPFGWMASISADRVTNFHEAKVSQYQTPGKRTNYTVSEDF